MKKFCKILLIIFIISILLFPILGLFQYKEQKQNFSPLNDSNAVFTIRTSLISIVGNNELNATANTGNGSACNPYIIKDIIIDAVSYDYGIQIQGTDAHFILQNCTIRNAMVAGIYLDNVTNAQIFRNQIINSSGRSGIYVYESKYNKILDNVITDCFCGIYLYWYSQNNQIVGNTIVCSIHTGIWLAQYCECNTLSYNNVTISGFYGIHLEWAAHNTLLHNEVYDSVTGIAIRLNSDNSTLINNSLADNNWKGIYIELVDQNRLINNTVISSYRGINLEESNNNLLHNNTVMSNFYGIDLAPCTFSNLSANTVCQNSFGIHFWAAHNNTLINNVIHHNGVDALWIYNTQHCNITHNLISFNGRGIFLDNSVNNSITWNLLLGNQDCIVGNIAENFISNNTCIKIPVPPKLSPISPNPSANGIIYLNWSAGSEALFYLIYRNTSRIMAVTGLLPIANVTQNNYTDSNLKKGIYYYVIVAGNGVANSTISNCENVTIIISSGPAGLNFDQLILFLIIITIGIVSVSFIVVMKRRTTSELVSHSMKKFKPVSLNEKLNKAIKEKIPIDEFEKWNAPDLMNLRASEVGIILPEIERRISALSITEMEKEEILQEVARFPPDLQKKLLTQFERDIINEGDASLK